MEHVLDKTLLTKLKIYSYILTKLYGGDFNLVNMYEYGFSTDESFLDLEEIETLERALDQAKRGEDFFVTGPVIAKDLQKEIGFVFMYAKGDVAIFIEVDFSLQDFDSLVTKNMFDEIPGVLEKSETGKASGFGGSH